MNVCGFGLTKRSRSSWNDSHVVDSSPASEKRVRFAALLGRNGGWENSILMISGLSQPTSGEIRRMFRI